MLTKLTFALATSGINCEFSLMLCVNGLCNVAVVLYTLSLWKMAPRTAWSSGSVLIVAVSEIGNTKQWKTKRVLYVIYQEIFKIKTGIASYSVVIFIKCFFFFCEKEKWENILY